MGLNYFWVLSKIWKFETFSAISASSTTLGYSDISGSSATSAISGSLVNAEDVEDAVIARDIENAEIAKDIEDVNNAKKTTGHSTLYHRCNNIGHQRYITVEL